MRKPEDVRELLLKAPPFILELLAAVHAHNKYANKLGFIYGPNSCEWNKREKDSLLERRTKLRMNLLTALKSIGYRYHEDQNRRITSLLVRGGKSRKPGSILCINQDALFVFSRENYDDSWLTRYVITQILEGNNV